MSEYIERGIAVQALKDYALRAYDIELDCPEQFAGSTAAEKFCEGIYESIETISDKDYVPAADVVEVKHGRWLDGRCTNCWWEAPDFVQYEGYELNDWEPTPCCPNCGAKMNGGGDK